MNITCYLTERSNYLDKCNHYATAVLSTALSQQMQDFLALPVHPLAYRANRMMHSENQILNEPDNLMGMARHINRIASERKLVVRKATSIYLSKSHPAIGTGLIFKDFNHQALFFRDRPGRQATRQENREYDLKHVLQPRSDYIEYYDAQRRRKDEIVHEDPDPKLSCYNSDAGIYNRHLDVYIKWALYANAPNIKNSKGVRVTTILEQAMNKMRAMLTVRSEPMNNKGPCRRVCIQARELGFFPTERQRLYAKTELEAKHDRLIFEDKSSFLAYIDARPKDRGQAALYDHANLI